MKEKREKVAKREEEKIPIPLPLPSAGRAAVFF